VTNYLGSRGGEKIFWRYWGRFKRFAGK